MNFIDLFAGAGGLSEGFIRKGFLPVAHVEMDKYASYTLKTRTVYHYLNAQGKKQIYNDYLRGTLTREELYAHFPLNLDDTVINKEISNDSIDEIFNKIDNNLKMLKQKHVDVLIGGPPCQAYSLVGRARDPYKKERDPRNYLYQQYVKFLKRYTPTFFVFENVPGILTAGKGKLFEDIKKIMDDNKYEIDFKTLDASDYGVLQKRKRVILIGWKKGSSNKYPEFNPKSHAYAVSELLTDLPVLSPGKISIDSYLEKKPNKYLKKYNIREKDDILTQHLTRLHNDNDRNIYRLAIKLWNQEQKRIKYTDIPKHLQTHKNLESFLDRFKVVGANLAYTHTMVAHIAKDGHHYIHPDIEQARSLSVREAARIQSFPDNFFFEGPRTAIFTQIGNAVPPLMAEKIAEEILGMLSKQKLP